GIVRLNFGTRIAREQLTQVLSQPSLILVCAKPEEDWAVSEAVDSRFDDAYCLIVLASEQNLHPAPSGINKDVGDNLGLSCSGRSSDHGLRRRQRSGARSTLLGVHRWHLDQRIGVGSTACGSL